MRKMNLAVELQRLSKSEAVKQFSKYMSEYEKRVRCFVKDLNLRSKEAKKKGGKQLDEFVGQLKSTRIQVEKKILTVINEEAKNVNKRCTKLLTQLRALASTENSGKAKTKAQKKRKTSTSRTKTTPTKRKPQRKARASANTFGVSAPVGKGTSGPSLSTKPAR